VVPPEGATPSTPETGELVAAVAFSPFIDFPDADRWRDTSINLYADGRLIRLAPDAPGTMAEQRLSAEGVELVRSELLSTGLFDGEQMNPDVGVSCGCQVRVRDDAGRFAVPAVGDHYPTDAERAMVDPGVKGAVDHLVEFITHLDSSLPASAWADREVKAYVPSRYQFSVWYEPYQAPAYLRLGGNNRAVPDLSNVLAQFLPTPLLQVLDERGWLHTDWADSTEVPTADARALDQVLTDLGGRFQVWQGSLVYVTHGISLGLKPFLPDGALPY
jgi:hypothetical protein